MTKTSPMRKNIPKVSARGLDGLTHYLGAVVSVLLLIGLVVWGYKLVARDVGRAGDPRRSGRGAHGTG